VDAAVLWNPWVNQIEKSGKGKALFTSKDMPGLVPDLLVAQDKAIQTKRKDLVGMIKAWFDTEKFIREQPGRSRQNHGQGGQHVARGICGVPARHQSSLMRVPTRCL
jgi:ABC-type nitrate/sulfonate/bicarbonate transport system substrate-binding protein